MCIKRLLVLLTDFGEQDVYVGVMKGVIKTINPEIEILDLTHAIPPQNILAASYCLLSALPYYQLGTIYLAIVDPGVGSSRKALGIKFAKGYLIGPDNGLFSEILNIYPAQEIRELDVQKYWRVPHPSQTFHGRDIFAPVAAHLASGVALAELGTLIGNESLTPSTTPPYQRQGEEIVGLIQYIDHFGNLISNIPATALSDEEWEVSLNGHQIAKRQNYSQVQTGEIIALINSEGWVEIAVNRGSAQKTLQVNYGETVIIFKRKKL